MMTGSTALGFLWRAARHARTPRSVPPLLWKNVTLFRRSVQRALAVRRPGHWNELGHRLAARGRYEEALACYDQALAIKGDMPRGLTNRGTALRHLDRLDEAEISLREALRLKPDLASAHHELGNYSTTSDASRKPKQARARRCASDPRMHSLMPDSGTYSIISAGPLNPRRAIARHWPVNRAVPNGTWDSALPS